jgi:hypothetical protein
MKLKPALLFWTNVVNALAFLGLALTGLLLHYGPAAWMGGELSRGRGRGWWLWGYHKHDYQELHFWMAIVMLAGIAFHLALHSKYLKAAPLKHLGINRMVDWLMTNPAQRRSA